MSLSPCTDVKAIIAPAGNEAPSEQLTSVEPDQVRRAAIYAGDAAERLGVSVPRHA